MSEKELACFWCGSKEVVFVASGVDERGEWFSMECEECGQTFVLRDGGRSYEV